MSDESPASPTRPPPSVFLSYASEDRKAAQALRDALPAYGLEVWYDESGLDGGDAWDQKIRRQIRECDFFMPVISAQTEVRPEGYFRREWRLAVERTQDMADDHTFILPVVIDDTAQAGARVPEKFLAVQWMRVPGGQPSKALEARCRRLVAGEFAPESGAARCSARPSGAARLSRVSARRARATHTLLGPHHRLGLQNAVDRFPAPAEVGAHPDLPVAGRPGALQRVHRPSRRTTLIGRCRQDPRDHQQLSGQPQQGRHQQIG